MFVRPVDGKQSCVGAPANPLNDIRVVGEAQRAVGFEVGRGHFHERDQLEQRRRVVRVLDGQAMTGAALRRALTNEVLYWAIVFGRIFADRASTRFLCCSSIPKRAVGRAASLTRWSVWQI